MPGEISPVNITQQYTIAGDESICAAEFCCDKNLSTYTGSNNPGGGEVWLKLEFDKVYLVLDIVVYTLFYEDWFDNPNWCVEGDQLR